MGFFGVGDACRRSLFFLPVKSKGDYFGGRTTQYKSGHNQTGIETGFAVGVSGAIANKIITQLKVVRYGLVDTPKKNCCSASIVCPSDTPGITAASQSWMKSKPTKPVLFQYEPYWTLRQ